MTFRDDGAAALEWAARYLDRVGDFPVLAQVEPGDIRGRLPAAPPEQGEPFANVLRDLDEILLPGITHWQSPRFFAYFANSAAEPGILAELLAATLNSVAFIWRTSPASTELEAQAILEDIRAARGYLDKETLQDVCRMPERSKQHIERIVDSLQETAAAYTKRYSSGSIST